MSMPDTVSVGRLVSISYLIRDESRQIVEYSGLPLSYVHGGGQHELLPQIETALEGKSVGDEITVAIACENAFGPHNPGLTFTDDIENAPEEVRFVGAELDAENSTGEELHFLVTRIEDGRITIDANHPLAGHDLEFTVTITAIQDHLPEGFPEPHTSH